MVHTKDHCSCRSCPFLVVRSGRWWCTWDPCEVSKKPVGETIGCRHHPEAPHPIYRERKVGADIIIEFIGYSADED